jgi:uncharacterized repeat protein (TIGR03803 family)
LDSTALVEQELMMWDRRAEWKRIAIMVPLYVLGLGATFNLIAQAKAQTQVALYNFMGNDDGGMPQGPLVQDTDGTLYGVSAGGAYANGTVFALFTDGTEKVLYSFAGGIDGAVPLGGLVRDEVGNLYGTTLQGGAYLKGTVFKLTPTGKKIVLHHFSGTPDGAFPNGMLIRDGAGNLYGTTSSGGASLWGSVFELTKDGTEKVLYSFLGRSKGGYPNGGLVRDQAGNLYGTAWEGGTRNSGVIFKLAPSGAINILHSFRGTPFGDGDVPFTGLTWGANGNLYGTTFHGGTWDRGTVFEVTTTGAETVLWSFADSGPYNPLVCDAKGNLYGDTGGGDYTNGLVFKLVPSSTGEITILHNFTGNIDGGGPSGLTQDDSGNLFGTTAWGGAYDKGTVYELMP